MVDYRGVFDKSFSVLTRNPRVILPALASCALPVIICFMLVSATGLGAYLQEMKKAANEFENVKGTYLVNKEGLGEKGIAGELAKYLSSDDEYEKEMLAYLETKGFGLSGLLQFLSKENLVLVAVAFAVWFVLAYYVSCMYFAVIASAVKGATADAREWFPLANRFLIRFIVLAIARFCIVASPIAIAIAVALLLKSILVFLILFMMAILLTVYLGIRIFFATYILFLEDAPAIASLKRSYAVTRGRLWEVVGVGVIVWAISSFAGTVGLQPLGSTFLQLLFEYSTVKAAINALILLVFLGLSAAVTAFTEAFIFNAYVDFVKTKKEVI